MTRVVIDPGSDSGNLRKFTIEVPHKWFKKGIWPYAKSSEDGLTYACGGRDTLSLSLMQSGGETGQTVLSSLSVPQKHHPNEYWPVSNGSIVGAIIELPQHHGKSKQVLPRDILTGRVYAGNHRVLYFEYTLFSHMATAADRTLLASILRSIRI